MRRKEKKKNCTVFWHMKAYRCVNGGVKHQNVECLRCERVRAKRYVAKVIKALTSYTKGKAEKSTSIHTHTHFYAQNPFQNVKHSTLRTDKHQIHFMCTLDTPMENESVRAEGLRRCHYQLA